MTEKEIRVTERSLLRRLGPDHVLALDQVTAAQANSRRRRGITIQPEQGPPWYIYLFRADELLDALRSAGVNILSGTRRVTIWDEL